MILQSVKMAWEAIRSNKMRSFLTMLGIIIGVTALVVLVSLVQGATGMITSEVDALGNDMLSVSVLDDKGAPIRLEDLEAWAGNGAVARISPSGSMNATFPIRIPLDRKKKDRLPPVFSFIISSHASSPHHIARTKPSPFAARAALISSMVLQL